MKINQREEVLIQKECARVCVCVGGGGWGGGGGGVVVRKGIFEDH